MAIDIGGIAAGIMGNIGGSGYSTGTQTGSSSGSSSAQNYASTMGSGKAAMEFENNQAERAMQFTATEAEKNRDWQERMSNSTFQRAVEDMKKAGINPILAAGAQAPTGQGAMGTGFAAAGHTDSESYGWQKSIQQSLSSAESYSEFANGLTQLWNGIDSMINGSQEKHGKTSSGKERTGAEQSGEGKIKKTVSQAKKLSSSAMAMIR